MSDIRRFSWPGLILGEAVLALANRSGLSPTSADVARIPPELAECDEETLGAWIKAVAGQMGLEAESVSAGYADFNQLLRGAAPALLRLPEAQGGGFLLLLNGGRHNLTVLGSDLKAHRIRVADVRTALLGQIEASHTAETEQLLDEAGIPPRRRSHARPGILRERLGAVRVGGCWLLRPAPGAGFWRQMRLAGLHRRLAVFVGLYALQYLLWLVSWWIIGKAALDGHLRGGWLGTWMLVLLTMIPVRLLAAYYQGLLTVSIGVLLKRRLLHGALRLDPGEIRHKGIGQLLGQVIESQAVEDLALGGGYLSIVASIELAMAAIVLSLGAMGGLHALLLLAWLGATALLGWRYYRSRRQWTESRLEMTHDLVERMAGHRTRLAQELPERWHAGEDEALEQYVDLSAATDRSAASLVTLMPRGWMILGLLGLAPAFIAGAVEPGAMATALGGILLAYRALGRLTEGLRQVAGAAIAWQQAKPLFQAAARPELVGAPVLALAPRDWGAETADGQAVIGVSDLSFRYPGRAQPVLQGVSLGIREGDRLLLESYSGSGKSTLASLLTGLRDPSSGRILLRGLDRETWGAERWRQRVAAAPQFHENHILTETLAFNLLMGRRWPPRPEDAREAEAICRELGLGELLDRMPGGLLQIVGETGWRLSHGERSRVFIARALLQGADVLILDESFGALDSGSLAQAVRCVLDRAPAVLAIAYT